jgi:hypothetical protein
MVKRLFVFAALLSVTLSAAPSFAQSTYATVSGTVEDSSHALLPGVTVTATNNATGVVTMAVSNESGAYNLPSLLPGTYTVKAELPGFQTTRFTNVELGNAAQVRLNFALQVATQTQSVEVTVAADTLLATSSSSIGEVLSQQRVQDLPIVGNNALSFFTMMPGVRMNDDGVTGTFAGIQTSNINVQRDGIDASASARWVQAGAQTATFVTPDLVGEIRIITTPVDAELGRGNGQVQFLTKSGTNEFHGAGVWFARNTALDANTWTNNRQVNPATGAWKATQPNWNNTHQLTGSIGGPIQKNKTFFFVLYDDVIVHARATVNPVVLTPCARNGIFRYFDGWNNGNDISSTTLGTTPTTAVVDGLGNPLAPKTDPISGGPFTGSLHYVSVFGKLPAALPAASTDCSNIAALVQPGTNWDPFRKALDSSGYLSQFLGILPATPNNYDVGDGLNTAGYRWLQNQNNGTENIFGYGGNLARRQLNIKIDHNLDARNKLGVSYTYEFSHGYANPPTVPGGFYGEVFRRPQTLSATFISTLTPTIVNEARLGMRRTGSNTYNALNDPTTGKAALKALPNYNGYPVMLALADTVGTTVVNGAGFLGGNSTSSYLDTTPLWTVGDSLSWTKGKHAFKAGAEIRSGHSLGFDAGIAPTTVPRALSGENNLSPIPSTVIGTTNMPGLAGTTAAGNNLAMRQLLDFLSGSLSSVTQLQFMENPTNLTAYEDYKTYPWRTRDFHGNEASLFFKDDYKVRNTLTLNLGLRWDYYGVPYESHGLMPAAVGGPSAIWGVSGSGFSDWMKPGIRGTNTAIAYFGKNSKNSGTPWYNNDYNNFGPAIGFAWQVPWLGAGKTTIRGGYQVTYEIGQSGNNIFQENAVPGSTNNVTYAGDSLNPYIDLTRVPSLIPVPTTQKPMQPVPTTDRTQQVYNPEANTVTPYTQNLTLAVTRSLRPNLTLDIRYAGTLARKQWNPVFNINIPNFLYNGLKDAFDAVRAGDDLNPKAQVLENMFKGINIAGNGFGPVGTTFNNVLQTAGLHLRSFASTQANLANGNYSGLATTLNTLNYITAFNPTLPVVPAGVNGAVMRVNNFDENFIVANPQFAAVNLITNDYSTNYHSLETQITLRPTQGITFQSTYTFSKNLGTGGPFGLGPTFTNPINRHADYSVQTDTRVHDFRSNGTFALPIGPNKFLFSKTSGAVARIIEGWQTGWIVNLNTGAPSTITANASLYGNGRPDVVGAFPAKSAKVTFNGTPAATGSYWAPGTFGTVKDPQCVNSAVVAPSLQAACTLNAIADAKTGQVLIQNAMPGTVPTMGLGSIIGPGRWRFDANISKAIKMNEKKSLQFRLDVSNILNHPEPNAPSLNLLGTAAATFGSIAGKSDLHRMLQAQLRYTF